MNMLTIGVLAAAALASPAAETENVMCTLPVLKSITDELSAGAVEVTALSKPDQDPHFVSPTPSLMKRLREADLFIEIGLQLEIWAEDVATGSGNPGVARGARGRLVASTGVLLEEVPTLLSRSEGDIHPQGNPHIWLDPVRVKTIAENIAAGLEAVGVPGVDERLAGFQRRLDEALFGPDLLEAVGARSLTRKALDGTLLAWLEEKGLSGALGGWMEKAAPLRGQKVVEFHRTWVYLSRLLGFEIVGSIEPKPGIKPGPKHLQYLRNLIESQGVRLLIVENYQDPSDPNALAAATGARVVIVPTQPGGETGTDDYFQLMDHVIDRLVEAVNR